MYSRVYDVNLIFPKQEVITLKILLILIIITKKRHKRWNYLCRNAYLHIANFWVFYAKEIIFSYYDNIKVCKKGRACPLKYSRDSRGIVPYVKSFINLLAWENRTFVSTLSVVFYSDVRFCETHERRSSFWGDTAVRFEIPPTLTRSQYCPLRNSRRKSRQPSDRRKMVDDIWRESRIERFARPNESESKHSIRTRSAVYSVHTM